MQKSAYVLVIISTLFNALGQLLFKFAMEKFAWTLPGTIFNWFLILGAVSYLASLLLFMYTLKQGDLSHVYPWVALTFIWVALLSWQVLHESMPWMSWAGITLITLGVLATTRGAPRV
ncbi:MAG: EamA family transporter [Candidatus Woesearchaeota archaeon]